MSLMSRIARGLVSRSQPEPATKPVPTSAPVAAPRAVSRAETRQRISAGVRRRLEPLVPQREAPVRAIDDLEAARLGILPDGELLDDVEPDWRSLRRGELVA